MAWQNPSTWSFVDRLQGQNNSKPKEQPFNIYSQDPNKIVGYINGQPYNFSGDFLPGGTGSMGPKPPAGGGGGGYQPPTPRLANFDVMANWRNAQSAAEKAVNPLYDRKLNDFLAQNQAKRVRKQQETTMRNELTDFDLTTTKEGNEITRQRTAEDVAGAIQKINTVEKNYQTDEGEDFDTNYRATAEAVAASGGATTGMGRQMTADMIRLRNVTNKRQLDEFNEQRQTKEMFKTRTFADLARSDTLAEKTAENSKKMAQFDLDAYLEDLAFDETNFRMSNEQERLGAVLNEAKTQQSLGTSQFLAGLKAQGYSAADILANAQVYGR